MDRSRGIFDNIRFPRSDLFSNIRMLFLIGAMSPNGSTEAERDAYRTR